MVGAKRNLNWKWLSWKLSPEEIEEQVGNYSNLKITKSYRGIVVLTIGVLLVLSLLVSQFTEMISLSSVLLSCIFYLPLLFLTYKGKRWAIIALIILWTIDKGATIFLAAEMGANPMMSIFFWLTITPYMVKSWKIENIRKQKSLEPNNKEIPQVVN